MPQLSYFLNQAKINPSCLSHPCFVFVHIEGKMNRCVEFTYTSLLHTCRNSLKTTAAPELCQNTVSLRRMSPGTLSRGTFSYIVRLNPSTFLRALDELLSCLSHASLCCLTSSCTMKDHGKSEQHIDPQCCIWMCRVIQECCRWELTDGFNEE